MASSPMHGLLAFGSENGHVEFFDPRSKQRLASLLPRGVPLHCQITSISFKDNVRYDCSL